MRASERAYRTLKDEILAGCRAAGSRIVEEALARELGISRTPVREAMRQLAAEGLVHLEANRGGVVADWNLRDLSQLYELRSLLEGFAARFAARDRTEVQAKELIDLSAEMNGMLEEVDLADGLRGPVADELADLNHQFHMGVANASGNDRVSTLIGASIVGGLSQLTFASYTTAELLNSMHDHEAIAKAILIQDEAWAEAAMKSHVLAGGAVMRRRASATGNAVAEGRKGPNIVA